jgi:hypothetical protein
MKQRNTTWWVSWVDISTSLKGAVSMPATCRTNCCGRHQHTVPRSGSPGLRLPHMLLDNGVQSILYFSTLYCCAAYVALGLDALAFLHRTDGKLRVESSPSVDDHHLACRTYVLWKNLPLDSEETLRIKREHHISCIMFFTMNWSSPGSPTCDANSLSLTGVTTHGRSNTTARAVDSVHQDLCQSLSNCASDSSPLCCALTDFRTSGGYNLSLFLDTLNFDYQLPISPLSNIPSSVQSVLFADLY